MIVMCMASMYVWGIAGDMSSALVNLTFVSLVSLVSLVAIVSVVAVCL
jgi:hypothetical protein